MRLSAGNHSVRNFHELEVALVRFHCDTRSWYSKSQCRYLSLSERLSTPTTETEDTGFSSQTAGFLPRVSTRCRSSPTLTADIRLTHGACHATIDRFGSFALILPVPVDARRRFSIILSASCTRVGSHWYFQVSSCGVGWPG